MDKIWIGPLDRCDYCGTAFGDGEHESDTMADAAALVTHGSRRLWGCFCKHCIADSDLDIRFAPGRGQRYELQTHGDTRAWFKTEG